MSYLRSNVNMNTKSNFGKPERRSPRPTKTPSINELKNKYKCSPKGKRKLDFPFTGKKPGPLSGKLFYLYINGCSNTTGLKKTIQRLGGIIEEFFRKEITYLVTDVNTHDCVKVASSVPSPGLPSPCSMSRSSSVKNYAGASPLSTDSPQGINNSIQMNTQTTRGKSIAQRSTGLRKGTTNILSNAETWGVKVLQVDKCKKWLSLLLQGANDCEIGNKAKFSEHLSRKKQPKVVQLRDTYIKVEDLNFKYRPLVHEFKNWPKLTFNTWNTCPFDRRRVLNNDPRKISQRPRTIERPRHGYCECCENRYSDLDAHLKSKQHRDFAKKSANYNSLDKAISEGPTIENFLNEIRTKKYCNNQSYCSTQENGEAKISCENFDDFEVDNVILVSPLRLSQRNETSNQSFISNVDSGKLKRSRHNKVDKHPKDLHKCCSLSDGDMKKSSSIINSWENGQSFDGNFEIFKNSVNLNDDSSEIPPQNTRLSNSPLDKTRPLRYLRVNSDGFLNEFGPPKSGPFRSLVKSSSTHEDNYLSLNINFGHTSHYKKSANSMVCNLNKLESNVVIDHSNEKPAELDDNVSSVNFNQEKDNRSSLEENKSEICSVNMEIEEDRRRLPVKKEFKHVAYKLCSGGKDDSKEIRSARRKISELANCSLSPIEPYEFDEQISVFSSCSEYDEFLPRTTLQVFSSFGSSLEGVSNNEDDVIRPMIESIKGVDEMNPTSDFDKTIVYEPYKEADFKTDLPVTDCTDGIDFVEKSDHIAFSQDSACNGLNIKRKRSEEPDNNTRCKRRSISTILYPDGVVASSEQTFEEDDDVFSSNVAERVKLLRALRESQEDDHSDSEPTTSTSRTSSRNSSQCKRKLQVQPSSLPVKVKVFSHKETHEEEQLAEITISRLKKCNESQSNFLKQQSRKTRESVGLPFSEITNRKAQEKRPKSTSKMIFSSQILGEKRKRNQRRSACLTPNDPFSFDDY